MDLSNSSISEIYEMKPISYLNNNYKRNLAISQVQNYVSCYKTAYNNRNAILGTAWNPDGRIVKVDNNTYVVLFTGGKYLNVGLLYYDFVKKGEPKPELYVQPYTVRDSQGRIATVYARDPSTGYVLATVAIAGGVILLVGTIAADIITAGGSLADDPVTIAAALELIRRGLQYVPAT